MLGPAVKQQHRRPVAGLGDMDPQAVRIDVAVLDSLDFGEIIDPMSGLRGRPSAYHLTHQPLASQSAASPPLLDTIMPASLCRAAIGAIADCIARLAPVA